MPESPASPASVPDQAPSRSINPTVVMKGSLVAPNKGQGSNIRTFGAVQRQSLQGTSRDPYRHRSALPVAQGSLRLPDVAPRRRPRRPGAHRARGRSPPLRRQAARKTVGVEPACCLSVVVLADVGPLARVIQQFLRTLLGGGDPARLRGLRLRTRNGTSVLWFRGSGPSSPCLHRTVAG